MSDPTETPPPEAPKPTRSRTKPPEPAEPVKPPSPAPEPVVKFATDFFAEAGVKTCPICGADLRSGLKGVPEGKLACVYHRDTHFDP